ncbi:MAG: hypothetical protein H0X31_06815 [Nostocaceae cyanobacterium]|nr:hypothetical protein [Nostocaceae cyanobacterium]
MTYSTLNQERFQLFDIPTRLNHLAASLTQIQSLATNGTDGDKIVSLMRSCRYYIEWTVPPIVDIDVDTAANIVDLGRILTRWLFDWEQIWTEEEARTQVAQQLGSWSIRIHDVSQKLSQAVA